MHVLITTDTLGGVWTYTRELVTALCRHRCRVTLISFGGEPADDARQWLRSCPVAHLSVPLRLEWMENAQGDIEAAGEVIRAAVERYRPDLLHTNQFAFATLNLPVPVLLAAHSDVVSWWRAVYGEAPPGTAFYRWYDDLVRRALAAADAVVAPSRSAAADLDASFGWRGAVAVIPNARSPVFLNPYATKGRYAATVGRVWDGGKQVLMLCRPGLALPIKIAGPLQHPVLGRRPLPAARGVDFLGEMSFAGVAQLLARARIYVGTSRYEPFGLAPLEAALSRCALLLNDLPTFREIWGETASYFRRDDGCDLASQLERFAKDENMCRAAGQAAYRRARALYSPDRMVGAYLNLYRQLLPARPAIAETASAPAA